MKLFVSDVHRPEMSHFKVSLGKMKELVLRLLISHFRTFFISCLKVANSLNCSNFDNKFCLSFCYNLADLENAMTCFSAVMMAVGFVE